MPDQRDKLAEARPEGLFAWDELFASVWEGKLVIAACMAIALLGAVVYLHVVEPKYTSELDIVPVQSSGSSLSKLGGLGDLASLAGVNLPIDQGSAYFQQYLEAIHLRLVADVLARDQDIMHTVFWEEWDPRLKTWREPQTLRHRLVSAALWMVGEQQPWPAPSGARLEAYLQHEVLVEQSPKSPIVRIKYDSADPAFGRRLLSAIHTTVDNELRHRVLVRARAFADYLTHKLGTVTVAEQREALSSALNEQEKSEMMAESNAPFAADPLGGPTSSFRPTSPVPFFIIASALAGGFGFGVALTLLIASGAFDGLLRKLRRRPASGAAAKRDAAPAIG